MEVLDTTKLNKELWEKYYNFQKELNLKYYNDKKLDSKNWLDFKENEIKKIKLFQNEEYKVYILINENQIVGWFDKVVTPINILFGFDSIFEKLPDEFINCLLKEVYDFIIEREKTEAFWWSYDERKLKQIEILNVEKYEDYMLFKLDKNRADVKLFKSWIDNVERKFKYHTEFYEKSSDFDIDKYAELIIPIFKEIDSLDPLTKNKNIEITDNDIKDMVLVNEKSDFLSYYCILFNELSDMIGTSNVVINKNEPVRVRYDGGLTAVHKNYRGNGLGRYLKAKMYFHLVENYPNFNFITTNTMQWNIFMCRINYEMGYKPFKQGAKFRFTKDFLENYLNKSK